MLRIDVRECEAVVCEVRRGCLVLRFGDDPGRVFWRVADSEIRRSKIRAGDTILARQVIEVVTASDDA